MYGDLQTFAAWCLFEVLWKLFQHRSFLTTVMKNVENSGRGKLRMGEKTTQQLSLPVSFISLSVKSIKKFSQMCNARNKMNKRIIHSFVSSQFIMLQ